MPILDPWLPEPPVPPVRPATPVQVFRYPSDSESEDEEEGKPTLLPNVYCLGIQEGLGDPGSATFRYVFDQRPLWEGAPQYIEQALSTAFKGKLVIEPGDRLLVLATQPDGTQVWIFDGYVLDFNGAIAPDAEGVTLTAAGIARHATDEKISDVLQRRATKPDDGSGKSDVEVQLVPQFNPRGRPNRTPDQANSGKVPHDYPIFLDPLLTGDPPKQKFWTLADAVRYILFRHNDEQYVQNPEKGQTLDNLLVSREPKSDTDFNPADPSTYDAKPIIVSDIPFLGMSWWALVDKLIEPYGFTMWPDLQTTQKGEPKTVVKIALKQLGPVKPLLLDARGERFDASKNNVAAADLGRTVATVQNVIILQGGLKEYECSLILAPGWPTQPGDGATAEAMAKFHSTDPAFATSANFDAYRLWVFDEAGEGHYANGSSTKLKDLPSLDDILGEKEYVERRRRPLGQLFKADSNGKPLQYRLSISTDYTGDYPAVWDGTGTWQHCSGGFRLLQDRIGIRITIENPNMWNIGNGQAAGLPYPTGFVKAIESFAAPNATNKPFFLRLTCVIQGDKCIQSKPPRSSASALDFDVQEVVDARDRYVYQERSAKSEFNNDDDPEVVRDDTEKMDAEAKAVRADKEAGVFDAEIHIPRFTRYYELGDRISQIEGRGLPFRTDNGGQGYAPVLPLVVARRWDFTQGQHTYLTLSDRGLNHTMRRLTRGETANLIKRSDKEAREVTGRTAADRKLPRATIGKGGLSQSDPERYRA